MYIAQARQLSSGDVLAVKFPEIGQPFEAIVRENDAELHGIVLEFTGCQNRFRWMDWTGLVGTPPPERLKETR